MKKGLMRVFFFSASILAFHACVTNEMPSTSTTLRVYSAVNHRALSTLSGSAAVPAEARFVFALGKSGVYYVAEDGQVVNAYNHQALETLVGRPTVPPEARFVIGLGESGIFYVQ